MNKSLLIMLFVPTTDATGKDFKGRHGVLGTGYPVGKNLILTALHVVKPNDQDMRYPIKIRWYYSRENKDWIEVPDKDIVWCGKGELDAALIRCEKRPSDMLGFGMLSTEHPIDHTNWDSEGFSSACKINDLFSDHRTPTSFSGKVLSKASEESYFELCADTGHPGTEEDWKGASGMPVFVDDKIIGVAHTAPVGFVAGRLYATPSWKLLEDKIFCDLIGLANIYPETNTVCGFLHNLPTLPQPYFKRKKETEKLQKLVWEIGVPPHEAHSSARVIGIWGMGGIGKTVLAIDLALKIKDNFKDGVFWVQLGKNPTITSCQDQLIRELGKSDNIHNEEEGRRYLINEFNNKRCLVILDDVWSIEHANAFNVLSEHGILLITSRHKDVISAMEGSRLHDVSLLEPEEGLEFLDKIISIPPERQSIAENIVKECGYLLWAIRIIGARLKMHPDRWDNYLQALKCGDLEKFENKFRDYYKYPHIFRALEVSIDELTEKQKQHYFDFGIFKEETPIPEHVPFLLWEADGINKYSAQDFCDDFVDLSLLRKDNTKKLIIHKLLLDYIHNKRPEADIVLGHNRLIDAYRKQCHEKWSASQDDGYVFQYLARHLCEAGQIGELCNLLTSSPDWLKKRADNFSALSSYYADAKLAIEYLPEPTKSEEIVNLISLYSAMRAAKQEAIRYSDEDLVILVLLNRTLEAFEYVHFRQEELEILGTLKIAETCLIENIDITLLPDPLRKIRNVARQKQFWRYRALIDSLMAKVFARMNQFHDAINTASIIGEPLIQNDTILDIIKVAMDFRSIDIADEVANNIKDSATKDQALYEIASALVSQGLLEDASKRTETMINQCNKEAVLKRAAEEWARKGELEKAIALTHHMSSSERTITLFSLSRIAVKKEGVENALKILPELQDPFKKCQCLSEIVKASVLAINDKHVKSALDQTYMEVAKSYRIGMQKIDALQVVAEVFVQVGNLEKARQIIVEIEDLIRNPERESQMMPDSIHLEFAKEKMYYNFDHQDDIKQQAQIKKESIFKSIAEAYWAKGDEQEAYKTIESISDKTIIGECLDTFVKSCCQSGELDKIQKIAHEMHMEFPDPLLAAVSQAYALIGDFDNTKAFISKMKDTDLGIRMVANSLLQKRLLDESLIFVKSARSENRDDILKELTFICVTNGDLQGTLMFVQQITFSERQEVLRKAANTFARSRLFKEARKIFEEKQKYNVEENEYIKVMSSIIQSFIFEHGANKLPKFDDDDVMPNFFKKKTTTITKIEFLAAEEDVKALRDEIDRENIILPRDNRVIEKLVNVLIAKRKIHATKDFPLNITEILENLLKVLPSIRLNIYNNNVTLVNHRLKAYMYCLIANALALDNQIDPAREAINKSQRILSEAIKISLKDLEEARKKGENGLEHEITRQESDQIVDTEKKINNLENEDNKYIKRIKNIREANSPSEIFNILDNEGIAYRKEFGAMCKIAKDIPSDSDHRELAEVFLANIAASCSSSEDYFMLAEAYLGLGLFKMAFNTIERLSVDYFISLICKPIVSQKIGSELLKKVLLSSLNTLSWTNQDWKPIYDKVKDAEIGEGTIEQTGIMRKLLDYFA